MTEQTKRLSPRAELLRVLFASNENLRSIAKRAIRLAEEMEAEILALQAELSVKQAAIDNALSALTPLVNEPRMGSKRHREIGAVWHILAAARPPREKR